MSDIVAVVTDLFFQGRIVAAARAANQPLRFVTKVTDLASVHGGTALVDLDASLDVIQAIIILTGNGVKVVAFGPHLDTESRKAARAAGANRVLAKSRFVEVLPELMASASLPAEASADAE